MLNDLLAKNIRKVYDCKNHYRKCPYKQLQSKFERHIKLDATIPRKNAGAYHAGSKSIDTITQIHSGEPY